MDTTTTIIVTVLANAIVTGIAVYLIQKRIESSFARKLEEFKAQLQYSNFEQQTKFARLHERRVEALEAVFRKLVPYADEFSSLTTRVGLAYGTAEFEKGIELSAFQKLSEKRDEVSALLLQCRPFLSPTMDDEIINVWMRLSDFDLVLRSFFSDHELSALREELKYWQSLSSDTIVFGNLDLETADVHTILRSLSFEVRMVLEKLLALYQSIVGEKTNMPVT